MAKPDDGDGFATIEILKSFVTFKADHHPGEQLRVPSWVAEKWVKAGNAKWIGQPIKPQNDGK